MPKTNTRPVSGTRDFLPMDVLRRKYVINIVEQVYQSYGFEPLETPAMERLDTLLGKYGEEGDQLIFRILKRGDKLGRILGEDPNTQDLADAGLRYDLTVPLARVAAEYQGQLPKFFKRYQIQPVFRADRPAKGRFREFYQCDLDIVGSTHQTVEAEVLSAAAQVLDVLGFNSPEDYRIRLNHRGVLKGIMQKCGVPENLEESALVAIDKLDKIGLDGVQSELADRKISGTSQEMLLSILTGCPRENRDCLDWLSNLTENSEAGLSAVRELESILAFSAGAPSEARLQIDPYLARGLSYYTGPIFEVEISGYSGSAGGGGRYDNLIGMFSGKQIPACGFSLGLERVLMIMDEKKMFPSRLSGQPEFLVTIFDENTVHASLKLAHKLRNAGFRVDLYPDSGKYGKQFKYADQRSIRFALLLSPHEIASGTVSVKDLVTGFQKEYPENDIAAKIREILKES